jgi:hypothetical protein
MSAPADQPYEKHMRTTLKTMGLMRRITP